MAKKTRRKSKGELKDSKVRLRRGSFTDALTKDEVTIIAGVLEMRHKTAATCMIHINKVFMLDVKEKVDKTSIEKIKFSSHSRVPLFKETVDNIVGFVLVKNLLLTDLYGITTFEDLIAENHDCFRVVKFVSRDINLLELLNLFQTGKTHLSVVVDQSQDPKPDPIDFGGHPSRMWSENTSGQVIGIITLEDVFEELIQEEIIDETDKFVDVEKSTLVMDSSLCWDPMLLSQIPTVKKSKLGQDNESVKNRKRRHHRCGCCINQKEEDVARPNGENVIEFDASKTLIERDRPVVGFEQMKEARKRKKLRKKVKIITDEGNREVVIEESSDEIGKVGQAEKIMEEAGGGRDVAVEKGGGEGGKGGGGGCGGGGRGCLRSNEDEAGIGSSPKSKKVSRGHK